MGLGATDFTPGRDLIAFDMRGGGRTGPAQCGGMTAALFESFRIALRGDDPMPTRNAALAACMDELAAAGYKPEHFGSVRNVEDAESIRQALGIDRWAVYGTSYGTTVGAPAIFPRWCFSELGGLRGDQGALEGLAGLDLGAAVNIQGSQMQQARLSREEARMVQDRAAQMSAAERAAAAAKIEDAVKQGMMIQDPATWDRVMSQQAPDLVGQFSQRQSIAAKYMSMAEVLKRATPEAPRRQRHAVHP
jgi:pimeloyl-ACP methyl ester carboxylesterase